MSVIKWIKLAVDTFDDEKIKLIESMPDGDSILIILFKLLCKAGKLNSNGEIYLQKEIPYTDEMFSTVLNKPIALVEKAINTLTNYGIIEVTPADTLLISNWEKHQNVDGMVFAKEQSKIRVRKSRAKARLIAMGFDKPKAIEICNMLDFRQDFDIEKNELVMQQVALQLRNVTVQNKNRELDLDKELDIYLEEDEKNSEFKIYGEYENVSLSEMQFNSLLTLIGKEEVLLKIIEDFSQKVAEGEEPKFDGLQNHFARLKAYWNYRRKHPEKFREEVKKEVKKESILDYAR